MVDSWVFDVKHEKLSAETFAANNAENVLFSNESRNNFLTDVFDLKYQSGLWIVNCNPICWIDFGVAQSLIDWKEVQFYLS